MVIKIKAEREGPPKDRQWRRLNDGMSVEVAGLRFRRHNVVEFIRGADKAGDGRFGIAARREPENPHSPHRTATAVDGWWVRRTLLGGDAREERHLGYLPEWASQECLLGKSPEPQIFVEVYSAYLGQDEFVDVDIIISVERTAEELEELEAERRSKQVVKEARKQCMPGLKILARLAATDGDCEESSEVAVMRDYVQTRCRRLGFQLNTGTFEQFVEAAKGLMPSDQTVLAAARSFAEDDESLDEIFKAALTLARADGDESDGEIALLRKVLSTVRRKRER
ncbi:hypothetical protein IZ6_31360 [Terrihabitans soli]|uniref:Uncharacterized protein n=1 Tax=Terrihabitans soli TaxID=708113 RepID=A0A6S6QZE4_9HYPH|nr:TerB family tellurite resistance protein [Terrihabitans soli]BCJ92401.1 hypothetical protein IZ6_31360 [Terrihabitans soli]